MSDARITPYLFLQSFRHHSYLSRIMRNPSFCICENKGPDQLHGNLAALISAFVCVTIPLLPISGISSLYPSALIVSYLVGYPENRLSHDQAQMRRDSTFYLVKTKALIIFTVTTQMICIFVFLHMQKAGFLMRQLIFLICKSKISSLCLTIYKLVKIN